MVIQHNIPAKNAYRNLSINQNALSGNLEKLSSGYQINRAGDNAAGLAISEKMRWQITGLGAAQNNVEDGISLIKVGESALQEVHDIVNRLKELAVLSANGTFDDDVDRAALQSEADQLVEEVDRISDATNFNGIFLLDGSEGSAGVSNPYLNYDFELSDFDYDYVTQEGDDIGFDYINSASGSLFPISTSVAVSYSFNNSAFTSMELFPETQLAFQYTNASGQQGTFRISTYGESDMTLFTHRLQERMQQSGMDVNVYNYEDNIYFEFADSNYEINSIQVGEDSTVVGEKMYVVSETVDLACFDNEDTITIDGTTYMLATTDSNIEVPSNMVGVSNGSSQGGDIVDLNFIYGLNRAGANISVTPWETTISVPVKVYTEQEVLDQIFGDMRFYGAYGLQLQIGETADEFNQLIVPVFDTSGDCLGIDPFDISDQDVALLSISKTLVATNRVSICRSIYGALQNRLEHTFENLCVMEENIQSAESTIRDTDIAEEMMAYTKNNILIQSAQSMLAQANVLPEGVLQLLG